MPNPGKNLDSRTYSNGPAPLPLFRPEAILYQQQKAYGDIILIRPLSLTLLVWLALSIVAAALGFLFFGHYTQKIRLQGSLTEAGASSSNGVVQAELNVPERWLSAVHPGTRMQLRCPACSTRTPEQAEIVKKISETPRQSSGQAGSPLAHKILVSLQPASASQLDRLQPGTPVEAEVQLGRKPFIKWLFSRSGS
jgi:hypothetical protein